MSFHLNWARLDETAAEALCHLINQRLKSTLDDIFTEVAAAAAAAAAASGGGGSGFLAHGGGSGSDAASGLRGGDDSGNGSSAVPVSLFSADVASFPLFSPLHYQKSHNATGGGGGASNSHPAAGAFGAHSLDSATAIAAATAALTATVGGGTGSGNRGSGGSAAAAAAASAGGGGAVGASSHVFPMASASPALPMFGSVGSGLATGAPAAATVAGPPPLTASTALPPLPTTAGGGGPGVLQATGTHLSATAAVGPGGGGGSTSSSNVNTTTTKNNPSGGDGSAPGSATASLPPAVLRAKPLLEHLCVTSLEWGTAPPFIELVNFSDALRFIDDNDDIDTSAGRRGRSGSNKQQQQGAFHPLPVESLSSSSSMYPATGPRGGGGSAAQLLTPTHQSLDKMSDTSHGTGVNSGGGGYARSPAASSPALGGGGEPRSRTSSVLVETSNTNNITNTCSLPSSSHVHHHHHHHNTSQQLRGGQAATASGGEEEPTPAPSAAAAVAVVVVVDTLSPFLGPGGLFVRLHVTYGGSLRLSLSTAVQYELSLLGGAMTLPLRMPLALHLSNIDLDCYVCCNLHRNLCRVWLEPGKLSASPINRMNAVATFGERRGANRSGSGSGGGGGGRGDSFLNGGDDGFNDNDCDSSLDYYSRYSDDDDNLADDDDAVLVDERQIEQFLLREVRALMRDRLVAPYFISLPVVIGQ